MAGRIRSATGHRRDILEAAPAESSPAQGRQYHLRFKAAPEPDARTVLGLDGLATLAEVSLNGRPVLRSDNMFVSHEIVVDELLREDNELLLHFHSLEAALAARRPRPRWRVPMIEQQQLRWFRTTLLGRTPGWSPPSPVVGPWRPIWLETRRFFSFGAPHVQTSVRRDVGVVGMEFQITGIGPHRVGSVALTVSRNGRTYNATLKYDSGRDTFVGTLEIPDVALWWPHTHGEPALYEARIQISGESAITPAVQVDLGRIGFRTLELHRADGQFALDINGIEIFCRGACWTPLDVFSLNSTREATDVAVAQAAAAGMNMLRVAGTMVYESDAFLDACDAQGILLWQDFMFANMDYPEGDAAFEQSVRLETGQLLDRFAGRPCLAVLCGNSEVEQQAAMWGAPRERWSPPLFHRLLPQLVLEKRTGVPYWPSSAHGGEFPHQSDSGTTSYYGVGAYRRPLDDARLAQVRFASECLGFANVPEEAALAAISGGAQLKVHQPQWKARSPRDLGAGWDFDDVRDHYLTTLFGTAALDLRYSDHARYLDLSRVTSGEVMAATFREWRRKRSTCNGALIWFLRDLWPGAGWGIVDALGEPKAPYYFLRRLLQPQAVFLTNEGVNGLTVHLANESARTFAAELEITLYRQGEIVVGSERRVMTIAPRDTLELPLASLFDDFMDLSYAYRFGPAPCEAVVAKLCDMDGAVVARDFHFPTGLAIALEPDVGLGATALSLPNGDVELSVHSRRLARYVTVETPGFAPQDRYFNLAPGLPHRVRLRRLTASAKLKGQLHALNSVAGCQISDN